MLGEQSNPTAVEQSNSAWALDRKKGFRLRIFRLFAAAAAALGVYPQTRLFTRISPSLLCMLFYETQTGRVCPNLRRLVVFSSLNDGRHSSIEANRHVACENERCALFVGTRSNQRISESALDMHTEATHLAIPSHSSNRCMACRPHFAKHSRFSDLREIVKSKETRSLAPSTQPMFSDFRLSSTVLDTH